MLFAPTYRSHRSTDGGLTAGRQRPLGILIAVFCCLFAQVVCAADLKIPFAPGEHLVFELKWSLVPAGEAALKILPLTQVDESPAYHFQLTARTNSVLDRIYKVRDKMDSYTDLQMSRTLHYSQKQREGNTRKTALVKFYWDRNEAQYKDLLKGKMRKPISILPGTFDPLAIFYYARCLPLGENTTLERPVTDGKKCVVGRATVVKRETVTVKAGTFDTFLMVPELQHIGGVFKQSENAAIEIWVTADEKKIPVKLRSEVVVGSFTAELVSYR